MARRRRRSRDAKLERLARVPLFAACTKGDLRRIASLAEEIDVPAGRVLMRQGDPGQECFVIVDGKARVTMRGRKAILLGPGDCFGELALLEPRGERTATVSAETDMDLLVLGSREFSSLLDNVPAVARRVLAGVAERLRSAERGNPVH